MFVSADPARRHGMGLLLLVMAVVVMVGPHKLPIVAEGRMIASYTTSLASRSASETLPNFQARMFKNGIFSWELETRFGNTYIRGTFNYSGDYYAAVGLRSDKKMRGPIVLCYINSTIASEAYADCNDYYGGDYDMQSAPTVSEVVAAATDSKGEVSITFRRLVRLVNATGYNSSDLSPAPFDEPKVHNQDNGDPDNVIVWEDFHRVIFAKGKFLDGASRPKQHDADDISAFLIDFNSGEVKKMTSYNHLIVLGVTVGFGILVWGGFAIKGSKLEVTPTRQHITVAVMFFYLCLMASMYTLANYLDYKATVVSKSHVRSLGDGAAFLLVASLIPVARQTMGTFRINSVFGVYLHIALSLLMLGFTFCHAIGMWYFFGDECLRWRDKDAVSKLPGIFSFLLMCFVCLGAIFRNKSPILWAVFRASHYIYIVAFFFAVCHYPKLAYGLAGPCLIYLIEAVVNHIYNPAPELTDIAVAVDEDSKCTLLRVHSTHTAGSADYTYYFIQIPQISRSWHPFFISLPLTCDPKDPHLEFLIKNTDFVYDQFWSRIAQKPGVGQRSADAEALSREASGSWTSELYHMALKKTPIESIRFRGPHGQPQLNLASAANSLLICGGVGIAPALCTLYSLATGMDEIGGCVDRQGSVSLIWVISDASLLNLYGAHLAKIRCHLAYVAPKTVVSFSIYITNTTAVAHCCGSQGAAAAKAGKKKHHAEEPLNPIDDEGAKRGGAVLKERTEIEVVLPVEYQHELMVHVGSRPVWMDVLRPIHAIIGAQMRRSVLEEQERLGSKSSSAKKKSVVDSGEGDQQGISLENKEEVEELQLCHLLTPDDIRSGGVAGLKECSVYMCGPEGMTEAASAAISTLEASGGPGYLLYTEPFTY